MGERTPIEERFWAKVDRRGDDECWPWIGSLSPQGYGQFRSGGDAHRYAYRFSVGLIPNGLPLDHTCHNVDLGCQGGSTCLHRRCVNPAHLEPVAGKVNSQRGRTGQVTGRRNQAKTHCPQGHPYNEANTYHWGPSRYCRACLREAARRYRAKRRMSA